MRMLCLLSLQQRKWIHQDILTSVSLCQTQRCTDLSRKHTQIFFGLHNGFEDEEEIVVHRGKEMNSSECYHLSIFFFSDITLKFPKQKKNKLVWDSYNLRHFISQTFICNTEPCNFIVTRDLTFFFADLSWSSIADPIMHIPKKRDRNLNLLFDKQADQIVALLTKKKELIKMLWLLSLFERRNVALTSAK